MDKIIIFDFTYSSRHVNYCPSIVIKSKWDNQIPNALLKSNCSLHKKNSIRHINVSHFKLYSPKILNTDIFLMKSIPLVMFFLWFANSLIYYGMLLNAGTLLPGIVFSIFYKKSCSYHMSSSVCILNWLVSKSFAELKSKKSWRRQNLLLSMSWRWLMLLLIA